ncbi:hypothetical protein BSL78_17978 [Apostichopus japonicus]|uniref:Uncharacterized protein n=1 Tax=Stichopus japonicus TaxID=307972 RepID=A0A2G8KAY9_STIJA|nr:hypothetical protein BSL78_17978 [Apostichopus japonicus]
MSRSSQSSDGLPAVGTMDTNLDLLMPRNQPSTLTENDWTKDKECAVSADDHHDDYENDPSLLINRSDNSESIIEPDDISRQNEDNVIIKEEEVLDEEAKYDEEVERVAGDLLMHEWTLQTFLIQSVLLLVVCVNCYFNSVQCDFVFDDYSAIIGNEDLRPSTPVWQIFKNDFWGTEITSLLFASVA